MAMKKRLIKVTLSLPTGDVVWDQSLMINIRVMKMALGIKSQATIDIGGLSQDSRQALLTQFSAYAKRQREQGDTGDADNFVPIRVEAGYQDGSVSNLAPIFNGQVVLCELASPPPNVVIRITAYTQQIQKGQNLEVAPDRVTFKQYAEWCAKQMGLKAEVHTHMDDTLVDNPGRTAYKVDALLPDLQRNYDRYGIGAYIDDDTLYVMDIGDVAKASEEITLTQFVGTPMWTEWGVEYTVMFDPNIKLGHAVKLQSILNPTVNNIGFVNVMMEYNLASRNNPFYINVQASPSAGEAE
ncbi:baseplate hub protein [Citrobacter sp.]|uniref:baseplate hub protein n=1 Tax=Citrobacter sp. TaxID=1896336 RepID=UPI002FCC9772